MGRLLRRCGAWLLLLALAGCGVDRGACGLVKVAELPLTSTRGRPTVTAELGGKPVRLIMDTGAAGMAITQAAITRLGLSYDERVRIEMRGLGGSSSNFAALIAGLKLGTAEVPVQRAGVLPTLPSAGGANADGVLSLPVLERFDIDLDVPNHRVAFYQGRFCPGEALPIPGPATVIDMSYTHDQPHVRVPVELDGRQYPALLDTGAQLSLVRAGAVGLPAEAAAGERTIAMTGVGPTRRHAYLHRFHSFKVGDDAFAAPNVIVLDDVGLNFDIILGMDYLAHRRVFLSFSTDRLYVQHLPKP
jgi:predicted aspartyl protease